MPLPATMAGMKRIHFFKAGRHSAMSGAVINFTEADLQRSAAVYDPAVHEAPLVVGHPKTDGPAYGGVKAIQFADADLEAVPGDVDPAFAELVQAKRYGKVSASWYRPGSPQHPLAGKDGHDAWYLRHIGFLGAQPPAIKGLRPIEFAADDADSVVEFGDWSDRKSAGLWRRMREFLIAQFGPEKADQVVPTYMVDMLTEDALKPEQPPEASTNTPNYAEGGDPLKTAQEIAAAQAALEAREAELAKREQAVADFAEKQAAADKQRLADEAADFAEGLVKAGQLPPAQKARVVNLLTTMPPDARFVDFAEDGKETERGCAEVLKDLLTNLPKAVDFAERGGRAKAAAGGAGMSSPDDVADKARAYMAEQKAAGKEVDFAEAVQYVNDQDGGGAD